VHIRYVALDLLPVSPCVELEILVLVASREMFHKVWNSGVDIQF
jgi:hypothetical protein